VSFEFVAAAIDSRDNNPREKDQAIVLCVLLNILSANQIWSLNSMEFNGYH
jgi:hypothetical protein